MKRLLLTLIILIALVQWTHADYGPAFAIARARDLTKLMHRMVTYVQDSPNRIKTPEETLRDGGDCADQAAMLVEWLTYEGIHATVEALDLRDYVENHAVVRLYGATFDPTRGEMYWGPFPLPHTVGSVFDMKNLAVDWGRVRPIVRDVWFTEK